MGLKVKAKFIADFEYFFKFAKGKVERI